MRSLRLLILTCLLALAASQALAADPPQDARKHTKPGKYLNSAEAYAQWKQAPSSTFLIDVRTAEEYALVGHPTMARNLPFMLWTGKYDAQRKTYALVPNPDFVAAMKRLHKPGDTLLIICRSGHRSAPAVNALAEAGFTQVYSVVDGFEGDAVSDHASPLFGKRLKEGWRNSPLPWTTDLDDSLVYDPKK